MFGRDRSRRAVGAPPGADHRQARRHDGEAFLNAGVTTTGDREQTLTETPQGGILSPLLANTALSRLDDHFARQWQQQMATDDQRANRKQAGMGNWRLIRYADDFVVVVSGERHHAEALREQVSAVLAPMDWAGTGQDPRGAHRQGR